MEKHFVVFCFPRSGSNLVCQCLSHQFSETHFGLFEAFSPVTDLKLHDGKLNTIKSSAKKSHDEIRSEIVSRIDMITSHPKKSILKIFGDTVWMHPNAVQEFVLRDDVNLIILNRRGRYKAFLSYILAKTSGYWTKSDGEITDKKIIPPEVFQHAKSFLHDVAVYDKWTTTFQRQKELTLDLTFEDFEFSNTPLYETLQTLKPFNFLDEQVANLGKQNVDHESKIINIEEVKQFFNVYYRAP